MSACSASHFDPTGWPSSTWPSMTLRRTIDWRWVTSTRPFWRTWSSKPSADFYLRFRITDDLAAFLLGNGVDHGHAVVQLLDGSPHGDLLLGEAHSAELHAKAPELPGIAARGRG